MILPVQERLILMLSVDIDQQAGRIPEHPCAHSLSVDPADAPSLHETPAQRKAPVFRKKIQLFKLASDPLILNSKCQFHKPALRSAPEHVRTVLSSQREIDRAEQQ